MKKTQPAPRAKRLTIWTIVVCVFALVPQALPRILEALHLSEAGRLVGDTATAILATETNHPGPRVAVMLLVCAVGVIAALFVWLGHGGPMPQLIARIRSSELAGLLKHVTYVGAVLAMLTLVLVLGTVVALVWQQHPGALPPLVQRVPAPPHPPVTEEVQQPNELVIARYKASVKDGNLKKADELWKLLQDLRLPAGDLPNAERGDHCLLVFRHDEAVDRYRLAIARTPTVRVYAALAMSLVSRTRTQDQRGDALEAIELGNAALELASKVDNAEDITLALHALGIAHLAARDLVQSIRLLNAASAKCPSWDSLTQAKILSNLSTAHEANGDAALAKAHYERALNTLGAPTPSNSAERAVFLANAAVAERKVGNVRRAVEYLDNALSLALRGAGCSEHPDKCDDVRVAFIRVNLVVALTAVGDPKSLGRALEIARLAYNTYLTSLDADHRFLAQAEGVLANVRLELGMIDDETVSLFRSALTRTEAAYLGDHPAVAVASGNLATALDRYYARMKKDEPDDVATKIETLFNNGIEMMQRLRGDAPDRDLAWLLRNYGARTARLGQSTSDSARVERGIKMLRDAVKAIGEVNRGKPSVEEGSFRYALALALRRAKRFDEAQPVAQSAADMYRAVLGGEGRHLALCLTLVARCELELRGPQSALPIAVDAHRMAKIAGDEAIVKATQEVLDLVNQRLAMAEGSGHARP